MKGEAWPGRVAGSLLLVQQWLFVGIAEEVLVRGYLLNRFMVSFNSLSKRLATVIAVLLSSGLFALYHIPVRLYNQFPLQ